MLHDADAELPELMRIDRGGGVGERARALLRLGEGDDLADRLLADQVGREAIETERDPTHGRRAELERIEQKAEARARLVLADADQPEQPFLQGGLVDADRATRRLLSVQH